MTKSREINTANRHVPVRVGSSHFWADVLSSFVKRLHCVIHAVTHIWSSVFGSMHSPLCWTVNCSRHCNFIVSHFQLRFSPVVSNRILHRLYHILSWGHSLYFIFWNKSCHSWVRSSQHRSSTFACFDIHWRRCINRLKWHGRRCWCHQAANVELLVNVNIVISHRLLSSMEHLLEWTHCWLKHFACVLSHPLLVLWRWYAHHSIESFAFLKFVYKNFTRLLENRFGSLLLPIELNLFLNWVFCDKIQLDVVNSAQLLIFEKTCVSFWKILSWWWWEPINTLFLLLENRKVVRYSFFRWPIVVIFHRWN